MSLTGMSADLSKCHKAPVNRAPVSAADVALLACVYVLLSKFILATVQINIHSFIHHPCRQQSRGWGFHHCLSVFQTISQKRMQVKSPNSTHKCSTISYGRPFILGSKVTTSDWMQHCRCCSVCKWHWVFSASLPRVRLPLGFPRRMYLHSVRTGFFQFCERFSRVFDLWLLV